MREYPEKSPRGDLVIRLIMIGLASLGLAEVIAWLVTHVEIHLK
jgi:hypothetical protein